MRYRYVDVGGSRCSYHTEWDRRSTLKGTLSYPIAFDTETVLIDRNSPYDVPQIVLAAVSNQYQRYLIKPEDLALWIEKHQDQHLVCHNATFDFWVVADYLEKRAQTRFADNEARKQWFQIADEGRLHDTMALDQLIRLAEEGPREIPPRNLGVVAKVYANVEVDKEDPYRTRYGEILGKRFSEVDPGFLDYAIKDSIATFAAWKGAYFKALAIMQRIEKSVQKKLFRDMVELYGPLTESLQVRGGIALYQAGRNGIRVDLAAAKAFVKSIRKDMDKHLTHLQRHTPDIFVYTDQLGKGGVVKKSLCHSPLLPGIVEKRDIALTDKSQTPRFHKKQLIQFLVNTASSIKQKTLISCGKLGDVSTSAKAWKVYAGKDANLDAWMDLTKSIKTLGYAEPLTQTSELHPRYNTLLVTGRAAAYNPNLMQMPRNKAFRQIFKARRDHKLITVDYSFIELRTLASVCESLFGRSVLAQVIREGRDPHTFTASMVTGEEYDSLLKKVEADDKQAKNARQAAKAVNFGVPGGLGAKKLAAYAKDSYGVSMSDDEANTLRKKLIKEIYPELSSYLADTTVNNLSWNTGMSFSKLYELADHHCSVHEFRSFVHLVRKVVMGETSHKKKPISPEVFKRVWQFLFQLASKSGNLNPEIRRSLREKKTGEDVEFALFCGIAFTSTGRIRSRCTYTQSKNTPFQGLAADGAKLALFSLTQQGYRIVGFLHDEIIVEVPLHKAETALDEVSVIMKENMDRVLKGVTSDVSAQVSDTWIK